MQTLKYKVKEKTHGILLSLGEYKLAYSVHEVHRFDHIIFLYFITVEKEWRFVRKGGLPRWLSG